MNKDANICKNVNRKDNYLGCGTIGHYRESETEKSRQGGETTGPAAIDFCWKAVGGRQDALGLQHPEGSNTSSRLAITWRNLIL